LNFFSDSNQDNKVLIICVSFTLIILLLVGLIVGFYLYRKCYYSESDQNSPIYTGPNPNFDMYRICYLDAESAV
jgi:uncharacterized protein YneF (UPF0154 family)